MTEYSIGRYSQVNGVGVVLVHSAATQTNNKEQVVPPAALRECNLNLFPSLLHQSGVRETSCVQIEALVELSELEKLRAAAFEAQSGAKLGFFDNAVNERALARARITDEHEFVVRLVSLMRKLGSSTALE